MSSSGRNDDDGPGTSTLRHRHTTASDVPVDASRNEAEPELTGPKPQADLPAPTTAAPPPPVIPEPEIIEEKQCRICLSTEEDEQELGRLFRPCKCKGSMKVRSLSEFRE